MDIDQKMREAITLFEANNHAIQEIIKRGRKQGLNEAQIRAGMVKVWERIQAGENIKPIRLVWQAWAEAKRSHPHNFQSMELDRKELRDVVMKQKKYKEWSMGIGSIGWIVAAILAIQLIWGGIL